MDNTGVRLDVRNLAGPVTNTFVSFIIPPSGLRFFRSQVHAKYFFLYGGCSGVKLLPYCKGFGKRKIMIFLFILAWLMLPI